MRATLFIFSNLFAMVIAFLAADIAMANREPWRRVLASVAGFPVVVLVVVLSLGTLGQLSAESVTLVVGVAAALTSAIHWSLVEARTGMKTAVLEGRQPNLSETENLVRFLLLSFLGGFGGMWIYLLLIRGTGFIWDDLSYHAPAVAHWIVDERISLAPFNYHAYYPFNAEVLSLWFMLPFRSDGFASLSGLYWGILTVTASIVLSLVQGCTRTTAVLSGMLLLSSPVLLSAARSFSAADLAGPASVLAAVGLVVSSSDDQTNRAKLVDATYCGLLSGFAAGCKVSFVPVIIIFFLWQMFGSRKNYPFRTRALSAVIFAAAVTATGSYWYVRNWALTSNPLFPAKFGPFAGPFGAAEQARTSLIYWMMAALGDSSFWRSLIKKYTDWPFGLFLLALVGYSSAFLSALQHRRTRNANASATRLLLLSIGSVLLFLYPFTPFSGTNNDPEAFLRVSLRFVIAPFAIGMVLFGAKVSRGHPHRTFWLSLAILAVVAGELSAKRWAVVYIAAGIVAIWLWGKTRGIISSAQMTSAVKLTTMPVVLLLIALWSPYKQRMTDFNIYSYGDTQHPIGRAWQALETVPKGARVAWFGPAAYQYYPIFGRKLQLIPIPINDDGSPYQFEHEHFFLKSYSWWGNDEAKRELSSLPQNLVAAGVDYVLVTKWDRDEWPKEQRALANSNQAQLIYDDGYSAIWMVGRINRQITGEPGPEGR